MVKTSAILFLIIFGSMAQAGRVCSSKDFGTAECIGQKLQVEFDSAGYISNVEKLPGSLDCETGKIQEPRIYSQGRDFTNYVVNFNSETDGRLSVPRDERNAHFMMYSYTSSSGNKVSYDLECVEK